VRIIKTFFYQKEYKLYFALITTKYKITLKPFFVLMKYVPSELYHRKLDTDHYLVPAGGVDEKVCQLAHDVAQGHQDQEVGVGEVPVGRHFCSFCSVTSFSPTTIAMLAGYFT
jgi:hypothetical protein